MCERGGGRYAFELANVPGVIFVRPVAGEISRSDVCDDFGLDSHDLQEFESIPRSRRHSQRGKIPGAGRHDQRRAFCVFE